MTKATKTTTLFEVSWEVCNKVGGIYTVLSTKARTLTDRLGDHYIAIGPWLLNDDAPAPFDPEPGFDAFCETCRSVGIPVRVGRWRIPGSPRTLLVEFSSLYEQKDDILKELWEKYGVDSLTGEWDYVEPVLFGHAAGKVIELWWDEYLAGHRPRAVAQFHEWMTASGLLYLRDRTPSIGTVFTTHATMLGRALSSLGRSPDDGLGDQSAEDLAETHGVVAKHSIEGSVARHADVFTTVSEITGKEAELLHGVRPDPLLPNGIDLEVLDRLAGPTTREDMRARLCELAGRFLDADVSDACLLGVSGRYEFHNKGIDVLLDALAGLDGDSGRTIVLFVLVPAGNSGVRSEWLDRLDGGDTRGAIGISTHNLYDEENDPVVARCRELGLDNAAERRVKVIHIPIYLSDSDGFLNEPYEAVVRALDLTCFPSYYEPWGYTPQESLALGVPTITTDYAGFGRWADSQKLGPEDGVTVMPRVRREYDEIVEQLRSVLAEATAQPGGSERVRARCRETAQRTAWSGFIQNYERAFEAALAAVRERAESGVPLMRRPKRKQAIDVVLEGGAPRLSTFEVASILPPELEGLRRLAYNFYWCWNPRAAALFTELSPTEWERSGHNPVHMLRSVSPGEWAERAADASYRERLTQAVEEFDQYMSSRPATWAPDDSVSPVSEERPVVYFCAEFGIHESLPIYSGGLGILAGDHLKSASDLGVPMVAVGLFYRRGYLRQGLSAEGEQLALHATHDPHDLPFERVHAPSGETLEVKLQLPGRTLLLQVWRVWVGRVQLLLLDSDLPANRPEDRGITRNLYGGDHEMRLRQEIVLGRGGARALRTLGIMPGVFHINEGHAAFLMLERVHTLVRHEGLTFEEAREYVRATTAFTTHTPVPAGHDRFGEDLMRRYFSDVENWLGQPWERFMAFGQAEGGGDDFNMTFLALEFSSFCNGVSQLHGDVSKELLHSKWPSLLQPEVPIAAITNGIHLSTWTDPALGKLLTGSERSVRGADFTQGVAQLDATELWSVRDRAKARLLSRIERDLRQSFLERNDSPLLLDVILSGLDPNALLIGFARRFAPYKRAHLMFRDRERLQALLSDKKRPLRILVAGKAHPRDEHGKSILKEIVEISRSPEFAGKVFFLENYDTDLARDLVQGVDVWLNTPTRMLEASGTSGMKAAANGVLNLSIGDGWWPEAFDNENGWRIGSERVYEDQALQDQFDSAHLYRLLEEELLPEYFTGRAGTSTRWTERIRACLATIPGQFNTDRMVSDYGRLAYCPLAERGADLRKDRWAQTKKVAADRARVQKAFFDVVVRRAEIADLSNVRVGDTIEAVVELELGELAHEDLVLELVLGRTNDDGEMENPTCVPFAWGATTDKLATLSATHVVSESGAYAYGIRLRSLIAGRPGSAHCLRWL